MDREHECKYRGRRCRGRRWRFGAGRRTAVTAIASHEDEHPAAMLAATVDLDMHDWWVPTAAGYFEHVSKAQTLQAVRTYAPQHAARLTSLKKVELAAEAERLVAGRRRRSRCRVESGSD